MIYDRIDRLEGYAKGNRRLLAVMDFLQSNDLEVIGDGRYELSDGVFCTVGTYSVRDSGEFEIHKKYADLQLSIMGGERIEAAFIEHVSDDKGYSVENDCGFFAKSDMVSVINLRPGYFALLYPQDAHKPTMKLEEPFSRKAVFKIPLE